MNRYMKEVVAVLAIGTVVAVLSFWNEYLCYLPWKPFSVFLLFGAAPLLGGALRLRWQRHGREASYPLLTWAAIYWIGLLILLAIIGGVLQALRH